MEKTTQEEFHEKIAVELFDFTVAKMKEAHKEGPNAYDTFMACMKTTVAIKKIFFPEVWE